MTYRAVFFDAGETLVHPYPSFPELMATLLRREGIRVDPMEVRDGVMLVAEHFARAADDRVLWTTSPERSKAFWLGVYEAFLARLGLSEHDGLPERLYREFTDLSNYRLFPDVTPVLERLKAAGMLLGVISNFEAWLERLLTHLGVAELFDVRAISGIEGLEKPDPAIFRLALARAGLSPRDAVYVGDNPRFDTEPAEALGMLGVLIDRRGRYPDHVGLRLTTLDDLPAAIGLPVVAGGGPA
jgi:putative hydrolase of the HAD superfamily